MKAVCDNAIPYIVPGIEAMCESVAYLPGAQISRAHLMDADVLVVRTRTRVCRQLIEGTPVQLVVTATIGHDHIDAQWLAEAGTSWHNCPGCNADSVGQYVQSTLLALAQGGTPFTMQQLSSLTVAIVGHGHVGTAVERWVKPWVRRVIVSDPPKGLHCDLREADIITFHTPLTHEGEHATHHMADDAFFNGLTRRPLIINAARGGVVDEQALLRAMDNGRVSAAVIDTWEGEPTINPELLRRAIIATPHIAGYSADGKANATNQVLRTIAQHFRVPCPPPVAPPDIMQRNALPTEPVARALALYNPFDDSQRLKSSPHTFEAQRSHYPLRREQ